jgi:hypothetical protein
MENIDTILADYERADSNKRLNLYLLYPNLRRVFLIIDQSDGAEVTKRRDSKEAGLLKKLCLIPCASILMRIGRIGGE